MKQINLNVSGVPTDTPTLKIDTSDVVYQAEFVSLTRAVFRLPDSAAPHGATIRWADRAARFVVPAQPGAYEGSALGLPTLDYMPAQRRIRVSGELFIDEVGQRWLWRGCADFRLPQRLMAGEDITSILQERRSLGANLVRAFAMKANNTGWDLIPQRRPDYFGDIRRFFERVAAAGLSCEWTVFADTAVVMPDAAAQQDFFAQTCDVVRQYPFVFVELCNEWNHPTQRIDPSRFTRPQGILASHGSGLTDADTVQPRWDFATYHARRDGARGFTNYDPYGFQGVYPQPGPLVPDEGAKPEDYGGNTDFAFRMGQHARCGVGGTFHSNAGIDSRPFNPVERACAEAFFHGLNG